MNIYIDSCKNHTQRKTNKQRAQCLNRKRNVWFPMNSNYLMKNKKDIVELVQLHDVDHVFDRLIFLYKLDHTKWKYVFIKLFNFLLTPNSSLSFFDELNNRFLVSNTVDWYLFKRLFFRTIVGRIDEWLSGIIFVIGSEYERKSLNISKNQ